MIARGLGSSVWIQPIARLAECSSLRPTDGKRIVSVSRSDFICKHLRHDIKSKYRFEPSLTAGA